MAGEPEDRFHVADNDAYRQQLEAEARFWDEPNVFPFVPAAPALQRYWNERFTGQPDRQWYETIKDYGKFQRGCVLGAGTGEFESLLLTEQPSLHLTFYDISAESLARTGSRLEQEFPSRTAIRQEDLNFVELPADSHDLVVARSCVHHLVNLEHAAFQINRTLTRDGFFFMYEPVCESYIQFSEEKKRLFQAFIDLIQAHNRIRSAPATWPSRDDWKYSPFECARSGEILQVFRQYLQEVQVRTAAAMIQPILFARSVPENPFHARGPLWRGLGVLLMRLAVIRAKLLREKTDLFDGRDKPIGDFLVALDRVVTDTGYLQPGMAFAVYRKRRIG